jgi:hypothetical protein
MRKTTVPPSEAAARRARVLARANAIVQAQQSEEEEARAIASTRIGITSNAVNSTLAATAPEAPYVTNAPCCGGAAVNVGPGIYAARDRCVPSCWAPGLLAPPPPPFVFMPLAPCFVPTPGPCLAPCGVGPFLPPPCAGIYPLPCGALPCATPSCAF